MIVAFPDSSWDIFPELAEALVRKAAPKVHIEVYKDSKGTFSLGMNNLTHEGLCWAVHSLMEGGITFPLRAAFPDKDNAPVASGKRENGDSE